MIENNNFPWYLQQSSTFTTLYYGFFPAAETASPLEFGNAFNVDLATGKMLFTLGTYWGLNGDNTTWNGLIYNADNWSDGKVWTGGTKGVSEDVYRNIIKAKSYAFGRLYSLETIKGVLDLTFEGIDCSYYVIEEYEVDNAYDMGFVYETTSDIIDLGSVADPVTATYDYGDITKSINRISIVITASQDVIRTFIEMKAFDLTFIGKPVGVRVVWVYVYTD